MKCIAIIAFALSAPLFFLPAQAGKSSVTLSAQSPTTSGGYQRISRIVSYGDLDLTKAQDASVLLGRIESAARIVCGEKTGPALTGSRFKTFQKCQSSTVATAVDTVGVPTLTQIAPAQP